MTKRKKTDIKIFTLVIYRTALLRWVRNRLLEYLGFPFLGKGFWVLRKQKKVLVEKRELLLPKVDLREKLEVTKFTFSCRSRTL